MSELSNEIRERVLVGLGIVVIIMLAILDWWQWIC